MRTLLSLLALSFALTLPATARAQGPCRDDVERLCSGIPSGGGRLRACLAEHEGQLSTACRQHRERRRAGLDALRQGCGADVQRLCADIQPGGGRIAACLKAHEPQLSAACRGRLREAKARRAHGKPCAEDARRLCADLAPGGGRIAACLQAHEGELSPGCRARVEKRTRRAALREACGGDLAALCAGIAPGDGRLAACLKSNADRLSPACRAGLAR